MNFRGILLHNLPLKLVSVGLAALLWFNVASEQVVERTVSAPVEFLNVPPSLEISNDYVRTLEVHIGTRRGLLMGGFTPISAVVNLQDAREGERIIPITEDDVRKPDGVTVLNITPSRVTVLLERTQARLVPVEPQIWGTPARGYQLTQSDAFPSEILVTGPGSRVIKAAKATTESIDISGAASSLQRDVNVNISDPKLRIDRVNPVRVQVLIEPVRHNESITVPLVVGPGLQSTTRTLQLNVSYPQDMNLSLGPNLFTARLDKPAEARGGQDLDLPPRVVVDSEIGHAVRVDRVIPSRVKVQVQ